MFSTRASSRLLCACHIWITSALIFTPRIWRSTMSDNAFGVHGFLKRTCHPYVACMHTASDPTRRSRYTTRWFNTCANMSLYAHRERSDLRAAKCHSYSVIYWKTQCTINDIKLSNFIITSSNALCDDHVMINRIWWRKSNVKLLLLFGYAKYVRMKMSFIWPMHEVERRSRVPLCTLVFSRV